MIFASASHKEQGYVMLMVLVTVSTIAVIALLISREGSFYSRISQAESESVRLKYVTLAGLEHVSWWLQRHNACRGGSNMATVPLGPDSYSATVTGGASTTSYTLSVDQDTWIGSNNPAQNYGFDNKLRISNLTGDIEQALYRFDLSALVAGVRIHSAFAWFYINSTDPHPEGTVNAHLINTDWAEGSVTWDNFSAAYDSASLAMVAPQDQGGIYVRVNLTAQVQAWVNGAVNYGVLLTTTTEGMDTKYIAREGNTGELPRLEVVVGSTGPAPLTIQATGILANGVTRSLSRNQLHDYQGESAAFLQFSASVGQDAHIDSFYSPRNFGNTDYLRVSNDPSWITRSLLKFALGTVPAGAYIMSAQLQLKLNSVTAAGTASVHRLNRDWVEGTKFGTGIADGVNWYSYDGSTSWNSVGGDYGPAISTTAINSTDSWVTFEVAALIRAWLAGEDNNGLIIVGNDSLDKAEFESRQTATTTDAPKITITYSCPCGSACLVPQGSLRVLLVVGDSINPAADDEHKIALLESWGYTVNLRDDDASQATFDTDFGNNDVVFVSESVIASTLGSKVASASIGVVNEEGWHNDELGIETTNSSNWPVGRTLTITDTSHYITRLFPTGPLLLYDADMGGLAVQSTPSPDLQPLANWGNDTGLAVLEVGAIRANGGNVSSRRVMLPFGRTGLIDWSKVNNNGHLLLQRALQWGSGDTSAGSGEPLFLSTDSSAILGGLSFSDIDIVEYDTDSDTAHVFFDGDLSTLNVDITALHVLANGHLLLAGDANPIAILGGLSFQAGDLIDYDPVANNATLVFDGDTLFTDPLERINAVHVLDNGHWVLGTDSNATLGGLSFTDKDLVEYDPATGTASLFFDASLTTLNANITALYVRDNGHLVLAAKTTATLGGISFQAGDLVNYDPVANTATVIFDGDTRFTDPLEKLSSLHVGPGSGSIDLSCNAEFSANAITSEFSTATYPQRLNHGVTYFPPGQVLNGTVSPAEGAWIMVGGSGILWLVAMDGSELEGGYTTGLSQLQGVAFVPAANPSDPGHLAIVKGSNIYYSDLSIPANNSYTTHTLDFVSSGSGITYIDGGTYNGNLAIMDQGSKQIHIVNQSFNLVTSLATFVEFNWPEGIAHIKNTDKFLIIDSGRNTSLVIDTFGVVTQKYGLSVFGFDFTAKHGAGVAIHPTSCNHFFGDYPNNRYIYLNASGGNGPPPTVGGTLRDEFNTVGSYAGNDGSLTWSTNWLEVGESDGANAGDEQVVNGNVVRLKDNDNGGEGVQREADLTGYSTAILTLIYYRSNLDSASDYVTIDVSDDGGSNWIELGRIEGPGSDSNNDPTPLSYDISDYIAPNTRIRFKTSPTMGNQDRVFLDNVQIEVSN